MENIRVLDRLFTPFITRDEIDPLVTRIAAEINADYAGKNPLFLPVLNGAFIFAADLLRKISIPCSVSFVKYASYSGMQTTEKVRILIGLNEDIAGRHVIIVEDIVDSGITMDYLLKEMRNFNPASVRLACLFLKPEAFIKDFPIDYLGMKIPNRFIVGYGLDYNGYGRNLPQIYTVC
jgi:hypoxanthine phosphoribosyltransferase